MSIIEGLGAMPQPQYAFHARVRPGSISVTLSAYIYRLGWHKVVTFAMALYGSGLSVRRLLRIFCPCKHNKTVWIYIASGSLLRGNSVVQLGILVIARSLTLMIHPQGQMGGKAS